MAILADFSPFLEPLGIDEAYLDVTGFESLHGSILKMAEKIKQHVKDELGLCASIGIASSKVVAKVASEASKPDGLLDVPAGGESAFLTPMPVNRLPGIGKKSEQVLKKLNIGTIGQLAALPAETLKRHFGAFGRLIYNHASGIDDRKVEPPAAAKSISRETTFSRDTRDTATVQATLHYLSERVDSELRQKEKLARCITLKLRYADFTTTTRQQTLPKSADTDQILFDAGLKLLKKELSRSTQAVRLIGIGVSHLAEVGKQPDMLDPYAQRLEKLNAAVDRIRKRYGFSAIQTGRTLQLRDIFPETNEGYSLHAPSLSR